MDSIIDIIPKITSPLAVICFGFYVFYLFKKSQDDKKAKTLNVEDKQAQGEAARLILKDYPDLEIDPIKDPAGAIELAKQIVGDKQKLYSNTLNAFLLFSLIFATTYLVSLWLGRDSPMPVSGETWAKTASKKNKYPYATYSVIQHIKLRTQNLNDSTKVIIAEFRNSYTLSANRDIKSDEPIFEEQYTTSIAKLSTWSGSHKQRMKSNEPNDYWVFFEAKKDAIISVVTGMDYTYGLPIKDGSKSTCFDSLKTKDDEWFTCYPNTLDYIDDFTILVESDDLDISLPANAAYRKPKAEAGESTSEGSCKVYGDNDNCTLSTTWKNISPGECLGFKIKWKLKK